MCGTYASQHHRYLAHDSSSLAIHCTFQIPILLTFTQHLTHLQAGLTFVFVPARSHVTPIPDSETLESCSGKRLNGVHLSAMGHSQLQVLKRSTNAFALAYMTRCHRLVSPRQNNQKMHRMALASSTIAPTSHPAAIGNPTTSTSASMRRQTTGKANADMTAKEERDDISRPNLHHHHNNTPAN